MPAPGALRGALACTHTALQSSMCALGTAVVGGVGWDSQRVGSGETVKVMVMTTGSALWRELCPWWCHGPGWMFARVLGGTPQELETALIVVWLDS